MQIIPFSMTVSYEIILYYSIAQATLLKNHNNMK